ncbi:alpha/beta fold hydrolase [Inquilinus limosus]|uniref:alpha/beta fold hydrolase n=1 Tax=Inquilinus limosus TaxID=171674 RepID=UPI0004051B81|nr:alpha/beta fold hydrolase [Inquilinus limosus]
MTVERLRTPHLEIAYETAGLADGPPVVLVHGWPDDVRCWDEVTPQLAKAGCRIFAPYLRGCGPTRFLSADTMRSGAIAALGQDLADFLDGLDLRNVLVVGYDWGARAGYAVAALQPQRLRGLVAMAAGYATAKPIEEMSYELVKAYWYEWLVAMRPGREAVDRDRRRLCRYLWESWSPGWRFTEEEFQASAASWDNPDWAASRRPRPARRSSSSVVTSGRCCPASGISCRARRRTRWSRRSGTCCPAEPQLVVRPGAGAGWSPRDLRRPFRLRASESRIIYIMENKIRHQSIAGPAARLAVRSAEAFPAPPDSARTAAGV